MKLAHPKKALSTAELKPNTAFAKRKALVSALRNPRPSAPAPPAQPLSTGGAGYDV